MLTRLQKRLEKLEAATKKEGPRREVFMVSDKPVTLGLLEEEPLPPSHLRLYFASFGEGNERYKDVPREEVQQWLEGDTGLVVWLVHDKEPSCS